MVRVAERDHNGNRNLVDYPADYMFYYSHPSGSARSIYGDQCRKYHTNDGMKFKKELRRYQFDLDRNGKPKYKIFEADINPIFRCLATNYKGIETPKLNLAFFDIETGFCQKRGFAPPADPFNPITAISLYLSQVDRCIALALKPKTYEWEDAHAICSQFEDTFLFDDEAEMLKTFLMMIEDSDVLSGWNSTLFDIPYIVNRITRVLGGDWTRELCLWGEKPRQKLVPRFGREHESYMLVGRVHLDYLELYQKHNPQQKQSYTLDSIGADEVGENKVAYEGTLDDLYHKDFYKFIDYSRQDVMLLKKIDDKKRFIELANQIAHVNFVLLQTTMGSVTLVEQAIINEMHEMGLVVPCRKEKVEDDFVPSGEDDDDDEDGEDKRAPVVGAYVAPPKKGIHRNVGCVDINSLYPSAIRALNISPETVVGQVRADETKKLIADRIAAGVKRADAWEGVFHSVEFGHMQDRSGAKVIVDFDDGTTKEMSGRQLHDYIYDPKNKLCITANGTIFSTAKDGIIPLLLEKWYRERQEMQALKKTFGDISGEGMVVPEGMLDELQGLLGDS